MDTAMLGLKLDSKITQFKNDLEEFKKEMLSEIESAEKNEIISLIGKLNTRLDKIEERLSPIEED